MKSVSGRPHFPHLRVGKEPLVTEIVNREDHRQRTHHGIVGVLHAQQNGNERRLPIVAVNHVRQPNALREFDRGPRELREPLGVVAIVAGLVAVEVVAVEILGIVDEEVAHARHRLSFGNRRETEPVAQRNRDARNHRRGNLVPPISRQEHHNLVSRFRKRLWQRLHHVREAARLRVWQSFR